MRKNQNIEIIGEKVMLVPYKADHVLRYHEWMKSPELQELTASEPLTLEEEYDMQQKWAVDEDKCTFIVLDRESYEKTADEIAAMIGDTNLFFKNESGDSHTAEAEIMIAEIGYRRKKRGWEAMLLMLRYGCEHLDVNAYEVKISIDNIRSINMFSKIGFQESLSSSRLLLLARKEKQVTDGNKTGNKWHFEVTLPPPVCRSSVFNEVTMMKVVDNEWMSWLRNETRMSQVKERTV